MPTTVIKGATVLPFTPQGEASLNLVPQVMDVLIKDDKIVQCGSVEDFHADEVIEATNQLLMPGLIDAHTHSSMVLNKGSFEALPLELWMLYLTPAEALNPRLHYLCAAVSAIESLKSGCTIVKMICTWSTRRQKFLMPWLRLILMLEPR